MGFGAVGRNNEESETRGTQPGQQHWAADSMGVEEIVVVALLVVVFACEGRKW